MRFHPKRRASTDHKPGPSIARAPPKVPRRSATNGSPRCARLRKASKKTMKLPTMGVHNPGIRRIPEKPHATNNRRLAGRSCDGMEYARRIITEPQITRIKSKPIPGQPPANVEYRRRTDVPLPDFYSICLDEARPKPPKESIK